jgi:hypothetical protein
MKVRYVVFASITFVVNGLLWYYIIVFCAVYRATAIWWFLAALQGLIIQLLVFEFINPLVRLVIRLLTRNYGFL